MDIPWEDKVQNMIIPHWSTHHAKLKHDLEQMDLPIESKQSLDIFLHSLDKFIDVYKKLGLTTNDFVDLRRRRGKEVMGPDKWPEIEKRVSKE